jgi:hypothetical protein
LLKLADPEAYLESKLTAAAIFIASLLAVSLTLAIESAVLLADNCPPSWKVVA